MKHKPGIPIHSPYVLVSPTLCSRALHINGLWEGSEGGAQGKVSKPEATWTKPIDLEVYMVAFGSQQREREKEVRDGESCAMLLLSLAQREEESPTEVRRVRD